jgi:energy-coupling factor transporter ATP-binding protein EcfA2
VEKFLEGKAYYIHGDKGAGKTALLKHIEIIATQNDALVEYIRFKKDIDDEERNTIKRAGIPNNSFEEVIDKNIPNDIGINCVYAWQVYIIKCIVTRITASKKDFFAENDEWKKLRKLIGSAYKNENSPVKRILPKMKRGTIKLEVADIAELGVDFEWENRSEKTVSFSAYAKKSFGFVFKAEKKFRISKVLYFV